MGLIGIRERASAHGGTARTGAGPGGRWGYNTAVVATRDLSRTLVYSVNATDAKGDGMNATAMNIVVAAFGAPSAG